MLTREDFLSKVALNIADYPAIAPLYKAEDPRTRQIIDSMAVMLSMLSQQIEVAMAEPFEKTRDSTVLADAAMRGIPFRKATPGRVKILVKNENLVPVQITAGRTLLDSNGNRYVVTKPATIDESTLVSSVYVPGEGYINAKQYYTQVIVETATRSEDFYSVAIPDADDNSHLSALTVSVSDVDDPYEYRTKFINTLPDERVYTVEFDDRGQAYVRFGVRDVAGKQIKAGDVITIELRRSVGKINPKINSPFSFEYIFAEEESEIDWALVDLEMNELLYTGKSPMSISTLRQLSRYPSIYDDSAVFLGEFDFLIRKKYPELDFLSIWNEALEEVARGAGSLDNINALFVACYDGSESILDQPDPETPVLPTIITSLTDKQTAIKSTLLAADNSYKVAFYTPVTSAITITVTAKISTAHVIETVAANIKQALLKEFGKNAGNHSGKPIERLSYALLKEKIPELSVGNAYLKIDVTDLSGPFRPELWRYVTAASITVTVTQTNIALPGWGL